MKSGYASHGNSDDLPSRGACHGCAERLVFHYMQHADTRTVCSRCVAPGRCAGGAGCTLLQSDGFRPENIASYIAKNAYIVSFTDAGTPHVPEFPIITYAHCLRIRESLSRRLLSGR